MALSASFDFSQSSLQDFTDCRMRFHLRYVQQLAWPALQAEPALENERHIQRGDRFHRLAQQYLLGIPEQRLSRMAEADPDPHLRQWWANFLDCIPAELTGKRHVEVQLRAPAGNPDRDRFSILAVYDLILAQPDGRVTIYDWKTSARRPARRWLVERLQTRVYPYLLVKAGAVLTGGRAIAPDQVEMVYWFADPQHTPERIAYSGEQFAKDERFLQSMIEMIAALPADQFPMAASEKACQYCNYRSLCNRGIRAAGMDDEAFAGVETAEPLDFSLEEIGEIGF